MHTRRSFLPFFAGGLLAGRRLLAGTGVCNPLDYRYSDLPKTLGPLSSKANWKPEMVECRLRPLWSVLSKNKQDAELVKNKLRAAYEGLSRRTDWGGLAGQAYMHSIYCAAEDNTNVHHSSAFLPWHRAFLYFHERLLQKELNDPSFRLPVWDWENSATVPDLYQGWFKIPGKDCDYQRAPRITLIDPCMLQAWLLSGSFNEFAGPKNGYPPGRVTFGPHSLVHSTVQGYMPDFRVAAFDPIFYAHHCNVDRFWIAWRKQYGDQGRFRPEWPDKPWCFYDPAQGLVNVTADQFMEARRIGYDYDVPMVDLFEFAGINVRQFALRLFLDVPALKAFKDFMFRLAKLATSSTSQLPSTGQLLGGILQPLQPLKNLLDLVTNRFPNFALPTRLEFHTPKAEPGKYYLVALKGPANSSPIPIGGFGIFGHPHQSNSTVATAVCLKLGVIRQLLDFLVNPVGPGVQLVYGLPNKEGTTIDEPIPIVNFDKFRFEVRYPKLDADLKKFAGI